MCSRVLGVVALVVALLSVQQASAQNWVAKMIGERDHDFGTVARGADTVYKFPVKNIYKQDVELVSARVKPSSTSTATSAATLSSAPARSSSTASTRVRKPSSKFA
jgi:hypothetical protein